MLIASAVLGEEPLPIFTIGVIVATCLFTYTAWSNPMLSERYLFHVGMIRFRKQYERFFTSAVLHLDLMHLVFNMFSLYIFGELIEQQYGIAPLGTIYLLSILGGGLMSLLMNWSNHEYRALGASGGVCGVIFAYVFLWPGGGIMIFPIPFFIPAALYAILYLLGSWYAMKKQIGNIGHAAHIGGCMTGILYVLVMNTDKALAQPWTLAGVIAICVSLLGWEVYIRTQGKRRLRKWKTGESKFTSTRSTDYEEAEKRQASKEEIDRILDKINSQGYQSLSKEEKAKLDNYGRR